MFVKYQHVERFGTSEVEGIEIGTCHVFPKIDGTNGSVWMDDKEGLMAASRNRVLTLNNDNAGFYAAMLQEPNITEFLLEHPYLRLYGEWLVPHSLRTYREDAWNKFYVFDVVLYTAEHGLQYLKYDEYSAMLDRFTINYIPVQSVIIDGSYEQFVKELDKNTFLIQDGKGAGEGIIIKNYNFVNKYGRTTWAKIVRSEFLEKNKRTFGPSVKECNPIEKIITSEFLTQAMVDKVYDKITLQNDGWRSQYIPQLLGRVYHDLVTEEIWNFLKAHKYPTINFKALRRFTEIRIKELRADLF